MSEVEKKRLKITPRELKLGEVVYMVNSNVPMTAESYVNLHVNCVWFDKNHKLHRAQFALELLEKYAVS